MTQQAVDKEACSQGSRRLCWWHCACAALAARARSRGLALGRLRCVVCGSARTSSAAAAAAALRRAAAARRRPAGSCQRGSVSSSSGGAQGAPRCTCAPSRVSLTRVRLMCRWGPWDRAARPLAGSACVARGQHNTQLNLAAKEGSCWCEGLESVRVRSRRERRRPAGAHYGGMFGIRGARAGARAGGGAPRPQPSARGGAAANGRGCARAQRGARAAARDCGGRQDGCSQEARQGEGWCGGGTGAASLGVNVDRQL